MRALFGQLFPWILLAFVVLEAAGQSPPSAAPDAIKIVDAEPALLKGEGEWSPLPDYLQGATLLRPRNGNVLELTAARDIQILVAASWAYDGNQSGGWYESRTTLPQLIAAGWEPIGTIIQKEKGEHTLLRRTLKAGEHVKFHTRKYNPPSLILAPPEKLAAFAAAPRLAVASNNLADFRPLPATHVAGTGLVLHTHEADRQDRFADRGQLLRELVRQAVLLAAREELGIATRDDALRERGAGGNQAGPLPLNIVVRADSGGLVNITLFRFMGEQPEVVWDQQLSLTGPDSIIALAAEAERLSREEFPAVLRKAGYEGRANRNVEHTQPDATVQSLLADLHPLSQFAAARQIHRVMHEEGESPERLADLTRAYANLGALCEHLWYPAHKAFKARALLYAQRNVLRWPQSPVSRLGRAYALALVGLHGAAINDLTAAQAHARNGGMPALVAEEARILDSFCRFNVQALSEDQLDPAHVSLVRLLKVLVLERFSGTNPVMNAANQLLESVPGSDRAIEAIYQTRRYEMQLQARELGLISMSPLLYRRFRQWTDLPEQPAALVRRGDASDPGAERKLRAEVVRALRTSGELGADQSEPSWQAVAAWIEEVSFLQVARQMQFLETNRGASLDEARKELEPLVVDHPYRDFIAAVCDDPQERRARLGQFVRSVQPADVSFNASFLWSYLERHGLREGAQFADLAFKHQDLTYRDLLVTTRNAREFVWSKYAGHLRRVSPHSPLTAATTIEFDWDAAAPRAHEWEELFTHAPQVQGALGKQYLKQQRFADAVRCLTRQVALEPEYDAYAALAEAWLKRNDEARWLATWDEFLGRGAFGLDHARARLKVAEHFMLANQWQLALPYAEGAAETGAEWALFCAADCLTGLGRWDDAERQIRAAAEAYSESAPVWYFWCRRTGRGDLAAARNHVRQAMANAQLITPTYLATFLALEGEKEKALTVLRDALALQSHPLVAWQASLLADELKNAKLRDELLQIAMQSPRDPKFQRPHLAELARSAQEALATENGMDGFAARVQELLKHVDEPRERCIVMFLSGKLLLLHERDSGRTLIEQAARFPFGLQTSTLAAVDLRGLPPRNPEKK